ncbi:hypothetical protein EI42_05620 [Thermosporothrix hazakensis]|uniref:Uncharacterized protein n=1 Tax=Thermosporothrix hazakensis TaxID=644383 RepID=A0A326TXE1_THEHA|nr:hypothetical protein EI42_05620 [Thermosporothrix hazakensis]
MVPFFMPRHQGELRDGDEIFSPQDLVLQHMRWHPRCIHVIHAYHAAPLAALIGSLSAAYLAPALLRYEDRQATSAPYVC